MIYFILFLYFILLLYIILFVAFAVCKYSTRLIRMCVLLFSFAYYLVFTTSYMNYSWYYEEIGCLEYWIGSYYRIA